MRNKILIGLAALMLYSGCNKNLTHHKHVSSNYPIEREKNYGCEFNYTPPIVNEKRTTTKEENYLIDEIKFESVSKSYKNKENIVQIYHQQGNRPTILMFPTLGHNKTLIDKTVEKLINNFDVIYMKPKHGMLWHENSIEFSINLIKESVLDSRRIINYLDKEKERDYGVMGISAGAIPAITLAGVDERIKGGAVIFSGGDLGEMLTTTTENYVKEFREKTIKREGLNSEEFKEEIRKYSRCVEPLNHAASLNPKNFILAYSKNDKVINPELSERLFEKMNKPDVLVLNCKHTELFYYNKICDKVVKKLETVFSKE